MSKTQKKIDSTKYGALLLESLPKGYVIDDRYEIVRKLGQGGFGAVYLVHDNQMDIKKALKILPEAFSHDKEAMTDLQCEAKTMVSLNHANIVRVYDLHLNGEIKYIDMEYVDGSTLTELKLEYSDKRMPEEKVRELATQISKGIAFAHDKGVIHKDIKPQNVMVNKDGQVKIMDFGIAETLRVSMSRIDNTSTSGTLVYMSPEQIRGKNVGKESDIYSFGVMLYELLSGHPPFYKGAIEHQIINETADEIKGVSSEINEILNKCLKKDFKERIHNINDVVELLGGVRSVNIGVEKLSHKIIPSQYPSKKIQKMVDLSITTNPTGAKVWLDEIEQDWETPINVSYRVGMCKITIKKDGYETVNEDVEISENGRNEFTVELDSLFGSITVNSDEPDQIIIMNGSLTSETAPFTFNELDPGEYIFSLSGESSYSEPKKVVINLREQLTIELKTKKFSSLKINTKYKDISFKIGGAKTEPGKTILLRPGRYTLASSISFLPEVKLQVMENENRIFNYDDSFDKRSFQIHAGKYDVEILIKHKQTGKVIKTTITGEDKFHVLPGTLSITCKCNLFENHYNHDLTKRDDLLDVYQDIFKWRKKNRIAIFLFFIIIIILLAIYVD